MNSDDPSVKVFNATNLKPRWSSPIRGTTPLAVAVSPDGKQVAAPAGNYAIGIFDANSGEMLKRITGHMDHIFDLDWLREPTEDGSHDRLMSASIDATSRMWDLETGSELLRFDAPGWVMSARFSNNGEILAIGTINEGWGNLAPLRLFRARAHDNIVDSSRTNP